MIKTFKFLVTKCNDLDILYKNTPGNNTASRSVQTVSPEEIDKEVNKWLKTMKNIEVTDIKINVVPMAFHNNGGANVNYMYYTLIYREITP